MDNVKTDVLVVGGGAAGIAAAIGAAQTGVKVIVAERNSFFGGKATAAIVGTICGLYLRQKTSVSVFACKGFAKEFAEKLQEQGASSAKYNTEGLHYLPYHPFVFKSICDNYLVEEGIDAYLHTSISTCKTVNNSIHSLSGLAFDRQIVFEPKAVIDCSGEAIVSHLAGIPVIENEEFQAAAQVFTMHKVEADQESPLRLSLLRELTKAVDSGLLSADFLCVSIVPGSLMEKTIMLKIALPFPITHQLNSVTNIELDARKRVIKLVNFLTENVSAFKHSVLGEVATEAGIRTGRRPIGKYSLSENDVLTCRKFDTGIANGAWPIEFWEPLKKVRMDYFPESDFYQVPADCLVSNKLTNLFFAGRNISADKNAIASARVIGTCLQTGYAAGKLAAGKILEKNEKQIISHIRDLQIC